VIDTTPAWKPVVEAMKNLERGGRLVINAIRKENRDREALLDLDYGKHLWMEKEIKSVANVTGGDIAEFLEKAAEVPLRPTVRNTPRGRQPGPPGVEERKLGGGRSSESLRDITFPMCKMPLVMLQRCRFIRRHS
jgi:propanol-preferring alcohol dehydrogenase